MLLLRDILSFPELKNARIVSGHKGINNPVLRAGFLEWESGSDITVHFDTGEFVVTTLAAVKDNVDLVEAHLRSLIRKRVAAILIKDLYYHDIPQSLKDYSDEKNVPVIFFSDTYIDDILFIVKSELAKADVGESENILRQILNDEADAEEHPNLILQLDPYLRKQVIFCAFISTEESDEKLSETLDQKLHILNSNTNTILKEILTPNLRTLDYHFTWLRYRRGAFFILTCDDSMDSLPSDFPNRLMQRFFPEDHVFRIGISSRQKPLSSIRRLLKEALSTGVSCVLDHRYMMSVECNGIDRLLFNFADKPDTSDYYTDLLRRIEQTGASGSFEDYCKTLITYVSYAGDINKTAHTLNQHGNTIRYRIGKIQEAWECESRFEFNAMAYVFVRLKIIRELNSF